MTTVFRSVSLLLALAACGGGGGGEGNKPPAQTPAASAPAGGAAAGPAAAGSGKPLPVVRRVEDSSWITCPPPKRDSKKCEPDAPRPVSIGRGDKPDPAQDKSCPEDQYCLPTTEGFLCGPCEERATIRHVFKDRDFAPETNRDPFHSFLVKTPGSTGGSNDLPRDTTNRCQKPEQLRVTNYGYLDLKLVGIVRQGTTRKVLMMSPDNYGHIIKRGDCVGKEKAWVREIAENFICFEVAQELPTGAGASDRPPEGVCVELHTKQISVTSLPSEAPAPRTTAPVIQPPGSPTRAPQPSKP